MGTEAATRISDAIAANQLIWNLALFIFVCGVVLLSLYIRKINNFTIMETVQASAGFRKHKRNWVVNIIHALIIIVPLLLMADVVTSYENT